MESFKLQHIEFLPCDGVQAWPRGATAHPRSGTGAGKTPCPRGGGQEELPQSEVSGGCWEEQPHVQGAVAAWAQQGLEELFQVQGQEGCR